MIIRQKIEHGSRSISTSDVDGYKTRTKLAREKFQKAGKTEKAYGRSLREVARQVDSIVKAFTHNGVVTNMGELNSALRKYSELLKPWSRAVVNRMFAEVGQRDEKAWSTLGTNLGRNLRKEIQTAPTGQALQAMLNEQMELITSLPIEAAERVHKLTLEGITQGTRASEIAAAIMRTGEVTESRARMIARTEVARTASLLTQARSEHVGVTHYIWRTAGDSDVRESHQQMNGKIVAWGTPPKLSDGTITHAGQIFNCRCYPEPILPED